MCKTLQVFPLLRSDLKKEVTDVFLHVFLYMYLKRIFRSMQWNHTISLGPKYLLTQGELEGALSIDVF